MRSPAVSLRINDERVTGPYVERVRRAAGRPYRAWRIVHRPPDNHPEPLRNPPIPLLGDTLDQMSFGERAALEGVLSQLTPSLAIEIGTSAGGSLRRIARHSGHVHTFDLDDHVADKSALRNVTFHRGDSQRVLAPVLERCVQSGTPVAFALVDGDHSAAGVRADLEILLASPACARTMILLHDTMHPEVRAGIELGAPAEHANVVYVELDFFPGYEYATGTFAGQPGGGLGLVVTGDRGHGGYGHQPVQTLYASAFATAGETARARRRP